MKEKSIETVSIAPFEDFLFDPEKKYTWGDFYMTLRAERDNGIYNSPNAALIVHKLLTPFIKNLDFNGVRTNNETWQDVLQEAWIAIAMHIPDYDESEGNFRQFITKWFNGIVRETKSDGVSYYQAKEKGCRVYSYDVVIDKQNGSGEGSDFVTLMAAEGSSVEEIVERKAKEKSSALFEELIHSAIGENVNITGLSQEDKDTIYTNTAFYFKLFGGVSNSSDKFVETFTDILREA